MADMHVPWSEAARPPAGWRPPLEPHTPLGLFDNRPGRPRFREPHPIGAGPLIAGLGSGLLWLVVFGAIGRDLASYAWWTAIAAVSAWVAAAVLAVLGDRGVSVGVAISAGLGWSVAIFAVAARWISTGNWPMW